MGEWVAQNPLTLCGRAPRGSESEPGATSATLTRGLALAYLSHARSLQAAGGSSKVRRASVGLLRFGAAPRARRGCARRGAGDTLRRAVGVCARALAARALLRRACALVGGSDGGGRGWRGARCALGSLCGAVRRGCHPWCLNCPILPGALRVGSWWSARLVKGAARVWVCLWLGAALSGSARRCAARGGAGAHSGERLACVHWLLRLPHGCAGSLGARSGRAQVQRGWTRLALGLWRRLGSFVCRCSCACIHCSLSEIFPSTFDGGAECRHVLLLLRSSYLHLCVSMVPQGIS